MKTAIQKDAEGNLIEAGTKSDEEVLAEGGTIEEVEQEEIDEEDDKPVSDRDQMMSSLAEKRRLENAGESTDQDDLEVEDENLGTDDNAVLPADEQMVDLKVNGEVIQRSQAEVDAAGGVAAIQKSLSGDMKLQKAADERKQLDQDREEVRQVIGENTQLKADIAALKASATQSPGKPVLSQEELEAKAGEIAGKFFLGDEAELKLAVQEVLAAGNVAPVAAAPVAAPIDEDAIAASVAKKIGFENERKEAVRLFETDNADMDTPGRRGYVNTITNELMKENPTWGPKKVITEAVTKARVDLGIPVPTAAPAQKPDLRSKTERKRATTDAIPSASQRGVTAPVAGSQPKTKQQIFEQIEAGRSH